MDVFQSTLVVRYLRALAFLYKRRYLEPTQKMEKKSHSYSPSRMLNSMHLSLLPPKTTTKKTLVLDLDETLVHSDFAPFTCPSDIVFPIEFEKCLRLK